MLRLGWRRQPDIGSRNCGLPKQAALPAEKRGVRTSAYELPGMTSKPYVIMQDPIPFYEKRKKGQVRYFLKKIKKQGVSDPFCAAPFYAINPFILQHNIALTVQPKAGSFHCHGACLSFLLSLWPFKENPRCLNFYSESSLFSW
jgi:hypothetical protein